jgi:hypothetical protein
MNETLEQRANRLLSPQVAKRPVITPTYGWGDYQPPQVAERQAITPTYVWDQKAFEAFTNRPPVVTTPQSVVLTTTTSAWPSHCQAEAERYGGFPPVSPYIRPQQDEDGWPPTAWEVIRYFLIFGAAIYAVILLARLHLFCP